MNWSCINQQEAREKYSRACNKAEMVQILSELTCSTIEEMNDFLGIGALKRTKRRIDEETLAKMYYNGYTDREIAQKMGVTNSAVAFRRQQMGLLRTAVKQYTDEQIEELYAQGLSDIVIAEKLDISQKTIQKWRGRNKLPPNCVRRRKKKGKEV